MTKQAKIILGIGAVVVVIPLAYFMNMGMQHAKTSKKIASGDYKINGVPVTFSMLQWNWTKMAYIAK